MSVSETEADDREAYQTMLRQRRNLDEIEIQELLNFTFERPPETVAGQMRSYFLMLKDHYPHKAPAMLREMPVIKHDAELTEGDVIELCHFLTIYRPGFVLRFGGKKYLMKRDKGDNLESPDIVYVPHR